jgi:hypothetical protein
MWWHDRIHLILACIQPKIRLPNIQPASRLSSPSNHNLRRRFPVLNLNPLRLDDTYPIAPDLARTFVLVFLLPISEQLHSAPAAIDGSSSKRGVELVDDELTLGLRNVGVEEGDMGEVGGSFGGRGKMGEEVIVQGVEGGRVWRRSKDRRGRKRRDRVSCVLAWAKGKGEKSLPLSFTSTQRKYSSPLRTSSNSTVNPPLAFSEAGTFSRDRFQSSTASCTLDLTWSRDMPSGTDPRRVA